MHGVARAITLASHTSPAPHRKHSQIEVQLIYLEPCERRPLKVTCCTLIILRCDLMLMLQHN